MAKSKKSYDGFENCSGLRYLTPEGLVLRDKILKAWRSELLSPLNAVEIKTPCLIPLDILRQSGHVETFGEQIFRVNDSLALRPETAQGIFSNYKTLRRDLKGNPLAIAQVGLSFRNEHTSRSSALRLKEFEQMELEIFYEKEVESALYQSVKKQVHMFFEVLGFKVTSEQVSPEQLPHYSQGTLDFFTTDPKGTLWELGCLNLRGTHDLKEEKSKIKVMEVSLGLNRIIELTPD